MPSIDSVSPILRPQELKESYADYRDYLIAETHKHLFREPCTEDINKDGAISEVHWQFDKDTSPMWQLKLLLEEDINVESVTNVEMFIQTLKALRLGMAKMKTIQDQANFHKCWILYYNSVSFVDIFEYTNNLNAWDNPEDLVTTKIKRWAVIYNWKRRNC